MKFITLYWKLWARILNFNFKTFISKFKTPYLNRKCLQLKIQNLNKSIVKIFNTWINAWEREKTSWRKTRKEKKKEKACEAAGDCEPLKILVRTHEIGISDKPEEGMRGLNTRFARWFHNCVNTKDHCLKAGQITPLLYTTSVF